MLKKLPFSKSHRARRSLSLLLAAPLLLTAGQARAVLLGDTIKPFVSLSETYNSNVFRVKDKEQLSGLVGDDRLGDFITVTSAGSAFHYGLSSLESNLLLKRDCIRYSHYKTQSANRDHMGGDASIRLLDRVKIKADGSYLKEPQARSDFRSRERNDMTTLQYGLLVGYEMKAGLGFEAGYRRIGVNHSLEELRPSEYDLDRYTGTVSYRLSPEAKVYASYQRDNRNYKEGIGQGESTVKNANSAGSYRVGIEKNFSPKTTLSGHIGYTTRKHSARSGRDFSGATGKAELRYAVTPKLGLVLKGERDLYEESFAEQPYSVGNSASAGVVYQATEKVKASIMNKVTWKDFQNLPGSPAPRRKDRSTGVNAGIEWTPRDRLSVNVGYQYENRGSTDKSFKYSSHAVTVGVGYKF